MMKYLTIQMYLFWDLSDILIVVQMDEESTTAI